VEMMNKKLFKTFNKLKKSYSTKVTPKQPFYIIDSTLREGEQFSSVEFSTQDRKFIAKFLDKMGVDYIELVNPAASETAKNDCISISKMDLKAKILTHTRCHMHDVSIAVDTGVDGVNMYMATSKILREHSHGQGIDSIIKTAEQVIGHVKKAGLEVRFSCEDTFRSDNDDILQIYKAVDEMGVDRVGLADTVGVATPLQVYNVTKQVRSILKPTTGIEFHTHNDSGLLYFVNI
jgi:homocitrate synthase